MKRSRDAAFFRAHFYQEISWMIEQDDDAIIYRLGSDSPAMTKEQLMKAAKGLWGDEPLH